MCTAFVTESDCINKLYNLVFSLSYAKQESSAI